MYIDHYSGLYCTYILFYIGTPRADVKYLCHLPSKRFGMKYILSHIFHSYFAIRPELG